jgi:uncharacterized protein YdaU (DUF1376 family)
MSKRPDSFMPWYIGDYLRDTMHLTTRQHGAYDLLLMRYWASGRALPNDEEQLRAIAKLSAGEWKADRAKVLAFFTVGEDGLRQKRADLELARANEAYERRCAAGAKGNTSPKREAMRGAKRTALRTALRAQPEPQPYPRDLNPSGSNRRGARRAQAAQRDGDAAPPAPAAHWSDAWPRWAAFRAAIGEAAWACWFAACRLDGAETRLLAPGAHSRDEISTRFGVALERHFGTTVSIAVEPATESRAAGAGGTTAQADDS